MNRFLSLLLATFILIGPTAPAWGFEPVGDLTVAQGTITNANIVGVATVAAGGGTGAFIHSFAGATLANYLGHKIRLCDASTPVHCVTGYIKAAGTAEALGEEIVDTWINSTPYPYETLTAGVGNLIAPAINNAGGYGMAFKAATASSGGLYKLVTAVTQTSGEAPLLGWYANSGTGSPSISFGTGTLAGSYRTATAAHTHVMFWNSAATEWTSTTYTLKNVTAPAASGAVIGATKDPASAQSWAATEASFNPNSATFTYTISKVNSNPIVAGAAILATAAHISTVATGAHITLDAIDLSPYASTATQSWYLCVYSTSGATCAYTGAAGGGEALAAAKSATGITKANPGVITYSAGHGYIGGELIYFSGLTEMTSVNTTYRTLGAKVGDTFTLGDLSAATAAETTGGAVSQNVTEPAVTALHLRNAAKLGGAQTPLLNTVDPNAISRWSILYIGG